MNHDLDQEVVAGFISEAKSYLPEIMLGLEAFAAAPEQQQSLHDAFRYAHIIKGAASMLGFHEISELAYQLEAQFEMLSEKQITLTGEMLEDLCQTVSNLSDLLDTALQPTPPAWPQPEYQTGEMPVIPLLPTAHNTTDFDFFFSSMHEDKAEEKKETHLAASSELPSTNFTPPPLAPAESEPAPLSAWENTDFSVSLPETADTTTVGELNLNTVAAELKESFGNVPPPPQPEFALPDELMSVLPDFQLDCPPAAETSETNPTETDATNLLEVSENIQPDVSYENLADQLADDLLCDEPTSLPQQTNAEPMPTEATLPAPVPTPAEELLGAEAPPEEALAAELSDDIPELLPLPELPELLAKTTPESGAVSATTLLAEVPKPTGYNLDEFLPPELIVETPDIPVTAVSPAPQDLPEELLEIFLLEAEEHLQMMQTTLRALEKRPDDTDSLRGMRRSAHSLKGTAALVGFRNIMQLAHRMEDLLDLVYEGKFVLTPKPTRLLMQATHLLEDMSSGQVDEDALQQIYSEFDLVLAEGEAPVEIEVPAQELLEESITEPELLAEMTTETLLPELPGLTEEPPAHAIAEEPAGAELSLPDFVEATEPADTTPAETVPADQLLNQLPDELEGELEASDEAVLSDEIVLSDEAVLPNEIAPLDELVLEDSSLNETIVPSFASLVAESENELEIASEISIEPNVLEVAPEASTAPGASATEEISEVVTEATSLELPEISPTEVAPGFPSAAPVIEAPVAEPMPASVAATPAIQEEVSVPPTPAARLAQASSHFLRIPIERLEEVVKLIGEIIITRTAFEQRLADFARQVEELQIAGSRLRRASTDLEAKYEARPLGGQRTSSPRRLAVAGSAGSAARSLITHHTHGFDDLEFDRYTEFHLVSRELVESASDIQTVGREFGYLNSDFLSYLNRQSRIYNELQDRLMRLRMVPLSNIGPRLQHIVRQVSTHENKLVELRLEGETTAIDTTALQDLVDLLLHLLRNAVDHGIESPDVRVAKGKPATGHITLRAFYEGSQVILQLRDDGRGLDSEKIRSKAIEQGLLSAATAESLAQAELWSLIFIPGFSTASQVSEISGRGIGMEIVQAIVQKLKGTITIDSQPDMGVTFTIRLPLTLAVTRALMVKTQGQNFAIPLDVVTQIMRLDMSKVERIGKEPIIRVGGKIYPLLMLSRLLNLSQTSDEIAPRPPAFLINVEGREAAVIVDQLIGGREIVIKTLGNHLRNVHGVMGATLMGSGEVVLILNLAELVRGTTRVAAPRPASPAEETAAASVAPSGEPSVGLPSSPPAQVVMPTSKPQVSQQPLTVIIVDDSPSVRRVSANLIKNTGWIPVQAKDGLEALEKLQAGEVKPDIMMLDIEMPRMDGYQLLAALRALPTFRSLPVIMVSSRASEKHRQKAFDLGATDYLVKPYQEEQVIELIRGLVKNAQESR